ncbi:MAG: hypothetical protein RML32_01805 [Gammaproteobacteria bacterium]|nr:hypothetical protein [Gammaproteobacteria bacterium]
MLPDEPTTRELPSALRTALVISWAAFLTACGVSVVGFALLDPAMLIDCLLPQSWLSNRLALYTLGFFAFYAIATLGGWLAWSMLRTPPPSR